VATMGRMVQSRAAVAGILMVFAVVAVFISSGDHTSVAEDTSADHIQVSSAMSADDKKAAAEFMKDDSFWGAVKDDEIEPESTLLDKPKHELKKKGPNTVVDKKKEEAMVATVDEEEKESISDAQKSCNDAKKKVRDKGAVLSKEKRKKLGDMVQRLCDKVKQGENKMITDDEKKLAKKTGTMVETTKKIETSEESIDAEKALFKTGVGDQKVTGAQADKDAKNQATAKALNREAQGQLEKDTKTADKACETAKQAVKDAKAKGKAEDAVSLEAKAKKYCEKLHGAVAHEKQMIKKDVEMTALGKEGPDEDDGAANQMEADTAIQQVKTMAETKCTEAKEAADQAPEAKQKKAKAAAKELCARVRALVKAEITKISGVVAAHSSGHVVVIGKEGALDSESGEAAQAIASIKQQVAQACDGAMAKVESAPKEAQAQLKVEASRLCDEVKAKAAVVVEKLEAKAAAEGDSVSAEAAPAGESIECTNAKKMVDDAKDSKKQEAEALAFEICNKKQSAPSMTETADDVVPEDESSQDAREKAVQTIDAKGDKACKDAQHMAKKAGTAKARKMAEEACATVKKVEDQAAKKFGVEAPAHSVDDAMPEETAEDATKPSKEEAAAQIATIKQQGDAECEKAKKMAKDAGKPELGIEACKKVKMIEEKAQKQFGLDASSAGSDETPMDATGGDDADESAQAKAAKQAAADLIKKKGDAECAKAMGMVSKMSDSNPNKKTAAAMAKKACTDVKAMEAHAQDEADGKLTPEEQAAKMKKKKDAAVQVVEDKVNDACSDAMEKAQNSDDPDNSIAKAEALCDKLQAQGQKALKKIAPDVASKIKTVSESSVSGNDSESAMSDDSDDGLVTSKVYKTKSMEKTAQKQESQVIKAVKEAVTPDFEEEVATEMKTATDEIGKGDEMAGQGKTEKPMVEKVNPSQAKPLGKMPKKEVVKLETKVQKVEQSEAETKATAAEECKKAKHKVRDIEGTASQEERSKAAEAAIKFCEATDKAVREMEAEDNKKIGEMASKEAQKYGLKVSKVSDSHSKAVNDHTTTAVAAETKVFKKNIGSHAADDMSDPKAGTKVAKNEAMAKALDKKLDESKATIVKNLSEQKAKVDAQCAKAKASIKAMGGSPSKADARAAKLEKAIAFCKKAEGILAAEKKKDFKGLEDVKEKEYKSLGLKTSKEKAMETKAKAEATAHPEKVIAMDKEIVKISEEEEDKANDEAEKQEKKAGFVDGAAHEKETSGPAKADLEVATTTMAKSEDDMKVKVAQMCKQMKDKVENVKDPKKQAKSMKEATAFCQKGKELLKQQVKKDEAALAAAGIQTKVSKEDSKAAKKARIIAAEEAATKAETHIKKANEERIAKKTKELKDAEGAKIEDLAFQREKEIAEENIKKRAALPKPKPETPEEEKKIKEELAQNKEASKIMKNLVSNKKALAMIEDVLSEFEAMA